MADSAELAPIIERFAQSECSWLSTVRPSGKVHASPVWHVWYEGCIYVVTMETAVKARNIQTNPSVYVAHPDPLDAIIMEGEARLVDEMMAPLVPLFLAKYEWDISADPEYQAIIEITPIKIMAWGSEGASNRRTWEGPDLRLDGIQVAVT